MDGAEAEEPPRAAAAACSAEPAAPPTASATANAVAHDDGDPCTFRDRLQDGTCRGRPLHCDDDNPLTVDSCTGDGCLHAFVPGAFDGLNDRRTSP
jgi:hypothetical protein